jgi:hypothetical protein
MYLDKLKKIISVKLIIQLALKVILLFFGVYILYFTINLITINNTNLFQQIFSLTSSAFLKIMPALKWLLNNMKIYLIIPSIKFLWIPIAIYVGICLITPSWFWRKFLSLIAICGLIIFLHSFVFQGYSFPNFSTISLINLGNYVKEILSNTKNIFAYMAGIYLFILWIFPQATWSFFSGALLFLVGVIETALPTQAIPFAGGIIEFITLSGLFAYLFLFIHSLAAGVKLLTNSSFIKYIHDLIAKVFLIKKQEV